MFIYYLFLGEFQNGILNLLDVICGWSEFCMMLNEFLNVCNEISIHILHIYCRETLPRSTVRNLNFLPQNYAKIIHIINIQFIQIIDTVFTICN